MSTGYLAPLTQWLFQAASTLISTSTIFIIVIYFWARVSKNKDWLIACLKPRNSVELKKAESSTLRPKDFRIMICFWETAHLPLLKANILPEVRSKC